jgi:hypothetical protein
MRGLYIFLCTEILEGPSLQRLEPSWMTFNACGLVTSCHIIFHGVLHIIFIFEGMCYICKAIVHLGDHNIWTIGDFPWYVWLVLTLTYFRGGA